MIHKSHHKRIVTQLESLLVDETARLNWAVAHPWRFLWLALPDKLSPEGVRRVIDQLRGGHA